MAGAKQIFNDLGIPPAFLDKAFSMASPFASFVPGINKNNIKSTLDEIKSGMGGNTRSSTKSSKFNKNKYPDV